mmetsp:Transcript_6752/g.18845  ORF Transcript_6752/g.18845 Transcript_6752/m.18845 type:complete len:88 (-) Transcript_6752:247-510(-)
MASRLFAARQGRIVCGVAKRRRARQPPRERSTFGQEESGTPYFHQSARKWPKTENVWLESDQNSCLTFSCTFFVGTSMQRQLCDSKR